MFKKFKKPLVVQPDFAIIDSKCNYAIVSSNSDAILVNLKPGKPLEVDLDEALKISAIKCL